MKKLMRELHINHDTLEVINPDGTTRPMNEDEAWLYIVKLQYKVETNQFRINMIVIILLAVVVGLILNNIVSSLK
jgi:hypothetical protein